MNVLNTAVILFACRRAIINVLVDSMEQSLVPNDMGVKQRPVFHYFTFILHQMAKQYVIRMSLKNTHGLFTRLMLF
jgi:hypothetical protein